MLTATRFSNSREVNLFSMSHLSMLINNYGVHFICIFTVFRHVHCHPLLFVGPELGLCFLAHNPSTWRFQTTTQ